MCDYSMQNVASRPAKVGDNLVTKSFATTTTRGFAAVDQRNVAVCLLPGTELAFENEVDWYRPFKLFRRKESVGNLARFRQINLEKPHVHHDAIEFPNGKVILITLLCEGQRAKVLQLPSASATVQRFTEPENEADANSAVAEPVAVPFDPWFAGY